MSVPAPLGGMSPTFAFPFFLNVCAIVVPDAYIIAV
jgi:hypothetical protein